MRLAFEDYVLARASVILLRMDSWRVHVCCGFGSYPCPVLACVTIPSVRRSKPASEGGMRSAMAYVRVRSKGRKVNWRKFGKFWTATTCKIVRAALVSMERVADTLAAKLR